MAVVFAKVARIDYPRAWPGLFTDLLQQIQSQNTLVVRRVYLVLHHALKELASKRLSSDQKAFAEVNGDCFAFLVCCMSSAAYQQSIMHNFNMLHSHVKMPKPILHTITAVHNILFGVYKCSYKGRYVSWTVH